MKNKIIILMTSGKFQAVKQKDGAWVSAMISGKEIYDYESTSDLNNFCDEIKDNFNISGFDKIEMSVLVVKCNVPKENVLHITKLLEKVADFNVLDVCRALPLAVAQKIKIRKDAATSVNIFGENYVMGINDANVIDCCFTEENNAGALVLSAKDFGVIFSTNTKLFGADEEEVGKLKDENGKLKDENGALNNEIVELKDENAELKNKLTKTDKQLAETKKQLDVFLKKEEEKKNRSRTICYVPEFENNRSNIYQGIGLFLAAQNATTRTLNSKSDGSYIKKDKVIGNIEIGTTRKKITAPRDGRVFYLNNDWESVKGGEAFAIIGDENDTREDVMEWYKNQQK